MSILRLPRFQFSLRTLVILMVIVAVPACWHGARYARYRERLAARVQAAEQGLTFYARDEVNFFTNNAFPPAAEPTLAERWDRYWFGREGGKFPACEMGMYTYRDQPKPYEEKNYRAVLALHPEIEVAIATMSGRTMENPKYFQRIAHLIQTEEEKQQMRTLKSAFNDFARLPNLRHFKVEIAARLDDTWVDALPDPCQLQYLRLEAWGNHFSPAGESKLKDKAPQLFGGQR